MTIGDFPFYKRQYFQGEQVFVKDDGPDATLRVGEATVEEKIELLRRAIPTIIVSDIVGVSPLSAPTPECWEMIRKLRAEQKALEDAKLSQKE